MEDQAARAGHIGKRQGTVDRLALERAGSSAQMPARAGAPGGHILARELVDDLAVLGVDDGEPVRRGHLLHRGEDDRVGQRVAVVVHEQLDAREPHVHDRRDLGHPRAARLAKIDMHAVVDQAGPELLEPLLEPRPQRCAGRDLRLVDDRRHPPEGGGDRTAPGIVVVDIMRALGTHVHVAVDRARNHVEALRVDGLRTPQVLPDGGDALSRTATSAT